MDITKTDLFQYHNTHKICSSLRSSGSQERRSSRSGWSSSSKIEDRSEDRDQPSTQLGQALLSLSERFEARTSRRLSGDTKIWNAAQTGWRNTTRLRRPFYNQLISMMAFVVLLPLLTNAPKDLYRYKPLSEKTCSKYIYSNWITECDERLTTSERASLRSLFVSSCWSLDRRICLCKTYSEIKSWAYSQAFLLEYTWHKQGLHGQTKVDQNQQPGKQYE